MAINYHDVTRRAGLGLLPGLNIAIIVLPQAIAFSFLAGVPPHLGIYCAIYGVLFSALLNPSPCFHGGPNSSICVAIGVALISFSPPYGAEYIGYVLALAVMIGIMQLLIATIRPLSRLLDFMSEAVISGIVFGIGLFLIFKSIAPFGGLPLNTQVHWQLAITWQSIQAVTEWGNPFAIEIGVVTLISAIIIKNIRCLSQFYIIVGLICGTSYSQYLVHNYGGVMVTQIEQVGIITLPFVFPSIPTFSPEALPDLLKLLPAAFAISLLGLFQTVAIVRQTSRLHGRYYDTRKAICADGIVNIASGFLSALPGSGSFNRVALMQKFNIHSRWASIWSALLLALVIFFAKDYVAIIPLSAMAALIMLVGANMLAISTIKHHFRSKIETTVFLVALLSVHIFGLLEAVLIGAGFAFVNWVWHKSHPLITITGNEASINGEMYYASIPIVEPAITALIRERDEVVIDLINVPHIDPEGCRWLANVGKSQNCEVKLRLSSNQTEHEKNLIRFGDINLDRLLLKPGS